MAARCLFISNMVTLSLPKTLRSWSSATISRRFSGVLQIVRADVLPDLAHKRRGSRMYGSARLSENEKFPTRAREDYVGKRILTIVFAAAAIDGLVSGL